MMGAGWRGHKPTHTGDARTHAQILLIYNAMINDPTIRLRAQLAILNDVQKDYRGLTIENIIQQLESRLKHLNSRHHD
jgi:hypothetical protein